MSTGDGQQARATAASLPELFPDRSSPTPLYLQIAQRLYHDVATGQLRPGATIGSEAELTKRFGVSRVTLRQAIALLVEHGVVTRRHGKGTYVHAAPVDYPLQDLVGTTQVFSSQGRDWRSRVVSLRRIRATEEAARLLQVPPGERITEICRVDYAGKDALAVAYMRLPMAVARDLTPDDVERKPLYPLLAEKTGITADLAHQTMRAAQATPEVAELLKLEPTAAVMVVTRVTLASDGRPLEFSEVHFRADSVRFSISLRGAGHADQYAVRFQEHRVAPTAQERKAI